MTSGKKAAAPPRTNGKKSLSFESSSPTNKKPAKGIKRDFHAIGSKVTGATHLRQESGCQDALYVSPAGRDFAIACVADGHGSSACPHSADGAKAAVALAGELLESILDDISAHKDIWLPKQIETKWKEAVRAVHEETEREITDPFPYVQYGTTLLALAAWGGFVFVLQIGDGNILMIDSKGNSRPILDTERVGEDTESLCLEDAWKYIRTQIIPLDPEEEAYMFMISTDGYANSFADGAGFIKAGADYFNLWREEGLSVIEGELEGWLRKSSDKGSGDDIALALVVAENKGAKRGK